MLLNQASGRSWFCVRGRLAVFIGGFKVHAFRLVGLFASSKVLANHSAKRKAMLSRLHYLEGGLIQDEDREKNEVPEAA